LNSLPSSAVSDHVNRTAVQRRLDRLREEYGEFPVFEECSEIPGRAYEQFRERVEDGFTGGAYAWTVREPGEFPPLSGSTPEDARESDPHVLLAIDRGREGPVWDLPGGGREDGERYEDAAIRELDEETGIEVALDRPFLAHRGRYRREGGEGEWCHGLWVFFDASYEAGSLDPQTAELRGIAWFQAPPGKLSRWAQFRAVSWFEEYEVEGPWWTDADVLSPSDDADDPE
jgi:8-oxo-dGTP diphosphatase